MKRVQLTMIACSLALTTTAWAQTVTVTTTSAAAPVVSSSTSSYIKRTAPRFESFAGSRDNYASLATGLRSGSVITLTGSGETVAFNSPTKPMGYGNVTRALDLAQRQLAAQGITDPTPSQLQAAMMGGTITNSKGTVTYAGVLQMRADGMGWGQIAHSIGVHPGMGKSASAVPASSAGITSAAGGSVATSGKGGGKPASPGAAGRERASIATASGGGASSAHAFGRGSGGSAAASTAAGGNAGGGGHGNAYGRGGK